MFEPGGLAAHRLIHQKQISLKCFRQNNSLRLATIQCRLQLIKQRNVFDRNRLYKIRQIDVMREQFIINCRRNFYIAVQAVKEFNLPDRKQRGDR